MQLLLESVGLLGLIIRDTFESRVPCPTASEWIVLGSHFIDGLQLSIASVTTSDPDGWDHIKVELKNRRMVALWYYGARRSFNIDDRKILVYLSNQRGRDKVCCNCPNQLNCLA